MLSTTAPSWCSLLTATGASSGSAARSRHGSGSDRNGPHPRAAYDILSPLDFGSSIVEVVLQHHERQDGSGYPDGLAGEAILPAARVLAIADVVEAMGSYRPYRPALPLSAAVAELQSSMGVRYDEPAAAACLELMREADFLPFAVAGSERRSGRRQSLPVDTATSMATDALHYGDSPKVPRETAGRPFDQRQDGQQPGNRGDAPVDDEAC